MSEVLDITLIVNGEPHAVQVAPQAIFHDALHYHLPRDLTAGHRVTITSEAGDEIFPDMFIGETVQHFGTHRFVVTARPIPASTRPFVNIGFDHLAITVADRAGARDFFAGALQMRVMRDDPHLTVLTTGHTALFLFDADPTVPMSDGIPSRWHHLGFVVDDLDAAYAHLRNFSSQLTSDFILLERAERWSLYCYYRNGDTTMMIQLSEIKPEARGLANADAVVGLLYDYSGRRYGVRFDDDSQTSSAIEGAPGER